ncbi:single-strand selective monofunctional uracil DNA glycosylase [Venturia canescens]|uniref:single-strand selective monofunctional uracil DNA glycosylase n=1 Tax=Venturia canescens TaxID=32260 RepID=UPI001C9C3A3D|nr:single-strand selective monofunctional uracil DNA glycosylase [Venturia canescens]
MSSEKRAKLEDDDVPLDLSIVKFEKVDARHKKAELLTTEVIDANEKKNVLNSPLVPAVSWNIADCLLAIECQLTTNIEYGIRFSPPVEYLYNPISYAFEVHSKYVRQYCQSSKKLLFLGLNAGPWGMSQTGVPFGEISIVTNWLKLTGHINKPPREHPARKVTGFACRRSEVSGKRFWNLFHELCHTPDNFFRHSFLQNYCPVALMDAAGRNITPAELKGLEQRTLQFLCDEALLAVVKLLGVEIIVSIGRFAEKRARAALDRAGLSVNVLYIPHPSPRSPSNVNWVEKTADKLRELNLLRFFKDEQTSSITSGST